MCWGMVYGASWTGGDNNLFPSGIMQVKRALMLVSGIKEQLHLLLLVVGSERASQYW